MAQKSIKKNYIYNVTYQILLLLMPLITTPFVSRVLGADGIGTYSFTNSITQYFVLFATMGISTYGQREISYLQDDWKRRSQVFWETKALSVLNVLLCLTIYVIFVFFSTSNQVIYLIWGISVINVATDVTWFFQGMEEFKKIVIRNAIFKLLDVAFVFIFVKQKNDLPIYIFGIVFFQIIGSVSLWAYLPKYIEKPDWRSIWPYRNIKVVLSLFIPTIAIQVYTVLDKTMIGVIVEGSFENGYYEQTMKISKMVLTLVTSLGSVMIPRIGYHFERKEQGIIADFMYRSYNFVWFLAIPLCFGLVGISDNFVPWFFGAGYEKVSTLLKISGFLIIAIGLSNVTGMQYLIPTKRQNAFTFTVICGAVINVILNSLMIPRWKSYGAVIASVIAEILITLIQFYLVRKELSMRTIAKRSGHYFAAGFGMLLLLVVENSKLSPSVLHTFIMICSGAVIYFILLFIMKDEFFIQNVEKILGKLIKKKT